MNKKLTRSFWKQRALVVSKKLLGKYLCVKARGGKRCGQILEIEAYPGPYDRASHAFNFKKTPRNEAEYREGGHVYIYMVYGMYWQLNISTGKAGYPECVLIRALEPTIIQNDNAKFKNIANGPGKLCKWLKLDKSFYGEDVIKSKRIWFEDRGVKIKKSQISKGPRIGIDYAGPYWSKKKWRLWIKDNRCVSR